MQPLNRIMVIASALLMASAICGAQGERSAIIPTSQGTGGGSASSGIGVVSGMSDEPLFNGETIHLSIFGAADFNSTTRISESGEIAIPLLGPVKIAGLSSTEAGQLIADKLKERNLLVSPEVLVTVDANLSTVTLLGEVRSPGIYALPAKHLLSEVLATAGGLTASTGRLIEISNYRAPEQKILVPWDPTMHNTTSYDRPVESGDRILVRACGIAYVGGNVAKPGAYSLCGSERMTLSEVLTLAGSVLKSTSYRNTILIRPQPDGTKVVMQIDVKKVLTAKIADPLIREDDVIYIAGSGIKSALDRATQFSMSLAGNVLMIYH